MQRSDAAQQEISKDDSLRATLLNLALKTFADDCLEFVDRTGPYKQVVDSAIWTTPSDFAKGKDVKLDMLIANLEQQLSSMGMRAILIVASEAKLLEEQRQIRKRLYGGKGEA